MATKQAGIGLDTAMSSRSKSRNTARTKGRPTDTAVPHSPEYPPLVTAAESPTHAPAVEHGYGNCRAREIIDRIGDKWSVHVVFVLADAGTLRFSELRRRVDGISQRMLTVTLRGLERDGLVLRTIYPEVPPRVEYALTPLGETLREIVRGLKDWSVAHLAEVDAARTRYDDLARASAERAAR